MGWFTKAIPERKWAEISADLGLTLKKEATTWYYVFRKQSTIGSALSSSTLTDSATHKVYLLQLQAVASAIQEGGYIADSTFFLELVYIVLTGGGQLSYTPTLRQTHSVPQLAPKRPFFFGRKPWLRGFQNRSAVRS